ncbi:LicD family protein [Parabacteroides sp. PFB2-10]|uniref:LicD family protein n=1 Tax=Parabacteroides sp. PFB2-10 TaxID=1742405 RepID=UPI0024733348|nr:LicD family protein [Parabacteroides sp. PFB2-10]
MLDILVYVDAVCRKHNIDYWLSGGTLLGAVRHKGFIPWDDDLDIVLMKKDLKRLHQILLKESTYYQLQANDTDYTYVAPYEKLRIPNTRIKENNDNDRYYSYKGIYIDLFFWEPASRLFHLVSNKMQLLAIRMVKINPSRLWKKGLLRAYFLCLSRFLYPCLSFFSYLFARKNVSYPLGSFFSTQFEKEWIYPLVELEFEGKKFFVPRDYDAVLKAQYGDYWQLPDFSKIEFHTCSVEFDE